jgi:hypothetical protein
MDVEYFIVIHVDTKTSTYTWLIADRLLIPNGVFVLCVNQSHLIFQKEKGNG